MALAAEGASVAAVGAGGSVGEDVPSGLVGASAVRAVGTRQTVWSHTTVPRSVWPVRLAT